MTIIPIDIYHSMGAGMVTVTSRSRGRSRVQAADRHVGERLRQRRILLGLTQMQLGKLVGITYQQVHKYEKGINQIWVGRLFQLAEAMEVEVSYFFASFDNEPEAEASTGNASLLRDLRRSFLAIPDQAHQQALIHIVRVLAGASIVADGEEEAGAET